MKALKRANPSVRAGKICTDCGQSYTRIYNYNRHLASCRGREAMEDQSRSEMESAEQLNDVQSEHNENPSEMEAVEQLDLPCSVKVTENLCETAAINDIPEVFATLTTSTSIREHQTNSTSLKSVDDLKISPEFVENLQETFDKDHFFEPESKKIKLIPAPMKFRIPKIQRKQVEPMKHVFYGYVIFLYKIVFY